MPLKDTNCRNAKPQDKPYRLYDEQGLYLEVQLNGGRYWRLKYRFLGKEKRLALGVYPEVSLQEARRKRDDARVQLASGQDPSLQRRMIERLVRNLDHEHFFSYGQKEIHYEEMSVWDTDESTRYYNFSDSNTETPPWYIPGQRLLQDARFIASQIRKVRVNIPPPRFDFGR